MTIWFDIGDVIRFFQTASRPTGIQRFSFETCAAAARLAPTADVRFCRRGADARFRQVNFAELEAGIRGLAAAPTLAPPPTERGAWRPPSRLALAAQRLPPQYRLPLGRLARAGTQGLAALRDLARAPLAPRPAGQRELEPSLIGPALTFGPGDWLVCLGASWECPPTPAFLARLKASGTGFAVLAHDLIPDLFPEWCTGSMVHDFSSWLEHTVPHTRAIFAVSQNTARDLRASMAARGLPCPTPVVLPVGGTPPQAGAIPPRLIAEPYVLIVGTIEARKNHAGMLRVWRRLLATRPATDVPTLVFAGKVGWLTADLMQQLENTNYLGGKIRFINTPDDDTLASLYRHCLFTLFPSLYEGWGLPVSESLSFGKTVAASNRAAIPEAGGSFCAYFDPDNLADAHDVIAGLLDNPALVTALEARIAAQYAPRNWDDTAAALLAALRGAHIPALTPALTLHR